MVKFFYTRNELHQACENYIDDCNATNTGNETIYDACSAFILCEETQTQKNILIEHFDFSL